MYNGEPSLEARVASAKIVIGLQVYINNNAIIIPVKSSVRIGNDPLISPNFICFFDSNCHLLHPDKRLSSDYCSLQSGKYWLPMCLSVLTLQFYKSSPLVITE